MNDKTPFEDWRMMKTAIVETKPDELATARLSELGIDTSESDYRMALERIEAIFDAEPSTPEGNELENLASFVEEYEEKHFSF